MEIWFFDLLAYFTAYSSIIPIFFLLITYKMAFSFIWKAVLILCTFSICANILSLIFANFFNNSNPVFHIYSIIDFTTVCFIYSRIFRGSRIYLVIHLYLIIFLSIAFYLFAIKDGIWQSNFSLRLFSNIFIVLLALLYFVKVFSDMKYDSMLKDEFFWFNSAFLFYFGTTFYIVIFEGFIRSYEYDLLLLYTWPVQLVSMIIYNLILAKGIWTMRKLSS